MHLTIPDRLALSAIVAYQRYVSPFKGFSCAYRCHTGCASCSVLGFRAIRRYGLMQGLAVLRSRLDRCGVAYRRYYATPLRHGKQSGYCDLPCSGAELDCLGSTCDAGSCLGDIWDCGNRGRSKRDSKNDKYVYIPPNTKRNRKPNLSNEQANGKQASRADVGSK